MSIKVSHNTLTFDAPIIPPFQLTFLWLLSAIEEAELRLDPGYDPGCVMCENGTGTEYFIECSNCTTTFDTFRKDSLRRFAAPNADLTPNVFKISGFLRCGGGTIKYVSISLSRK